MNCTFVWIVIDTHVLSSAIRWGGTPLRLIERVRPNAVELVISHALLDEFGRVIDRPKFAAILQRAIRRPEHAVEHIHTLADVVSAPALRDPVCRDPQDDIVLACALAASAQLIVSRNEDRSILNAFHGIRIVGIALAWAMLEPAQYQIACFVASKTILPAPSRPPFIPGCLNVEA